jgi:hypothetical protein
MPARFEDATPAPDTASSPTPTRNVGPMERVNPEDVKSVFGRGTDYDNSNVRTSNNMTVANLRELLADERLDKYADSLVASHIKVLPSAPGIDSRIVEVTVVTKRDKDTGQDVPELVFVVTPDYNGFGLSMEDVAAVYGDKA